MLRGVLRESYVLPSETLSPWRLFPGLAQAGKPSLDLFTPGAAHEGPFTESYILLLLDDSMGTHVELQSVRPPEQSTGSLDHLGEGERQETQELDSKTVV